MHRELVLDAVLVAVRRRRPRGTIKTSTQVIARAMTSLFIARDAGGACPGLQIFLTSDCVADKLAFDGGL